jgi:hypothetical protein
MPVGTVASVKGVHQRVKEDINPDIILEYVSLVLATD